TSASASASGGILLAVTETAPDGTQSYWWTSPESPAWSAFDDSLRTTLNELGLAVIDPQTMANPPKVSRVVYGDAPLSTTNALNLGSLFGASRVISGEVQVEDTAPSPVFGEAGARVTVSLHIYSTSTSIELLPIE